jgi:uncharacterized protein (TIGR02611 family)
MRNWLDVLTLARVPDSFWAPIRGSLWLILAAVRKVVVFFVGMTVLIVGLFLIVLPGPAFVVIPLGLSILATEFPLARRALLVLKDCVVAVWRRVKAWWMKRQTARRIRQVQLAAKKQRKRGAISAKSAADPNIEK